MAAPLTKNNILAYSATSVCGVDNISVIVNKFNLRLSFCDSQRRFTLREYSQHQFTMILILTILMTCQTCHKPLVSHQKRSR
ncbi:hypothetical protein DM240_18430 [Escherichia coli]|nr:hypothetical protein [Escherichia coli]